GGRGLVQRIPALFGRAHRAFHCDEGEVLLAEGDGDTGGGLACGGQHPEGGGLVGGGEFPGGVAGVGDQVGEEPRDRVIAAVLVETPYVGGGGPQRGQVRCIGGVVAEVGEPGKDARGGEDPSDSVQTDAVPPGRLRGVGAEQRGDVAVQRPGQGCQGAQP